MKLGPEERGGFPKAMGGGEMLISEKKKRIKDATWVTSRPPWERSEGYLGMGAAEALPEPGHCGR